MRDFVSQILRRSMWLPALFCWASAAWTLAAPPSQQLLPNNTLAWVSSPKSPEALTRWETTQIGKLSKDPAMKPFLDDLQKTLQSRWFANHQQLDFDWKLLRSALAGEASASMLRAIDGGVQPVLMFDIGKNQDKALAFLEKIDQSLAKVNSRRTVQAFQGVNVVVHLIPPPANQPVVRGKPAPKAETLTYFLKDDLLCIASTVETIGMELGRWANPNEDSLAHDAAFTAAMQRLQQQGEAVADAQWFVRPLPLAIALQEEAKNRGEQAPQDIDYIKVMQKQGFEEIQGAGGRHLFSQGKFDVQVQVAVVAPGPRTKAARLLSFVNTPMPPPDVWTTHDMSSYTSFAWDVKTAFEGLGDLVDEVMEEPGFFKDLIQSTAEEPDGPKIDLRKDIVHKLGTPNQNGAEQFARAIVISDHTIPITTESQRALIAVQASDPDALAKNIAKAVDGDPAFKKKEVNGVTIYEYQEQPRKPRRGTKKAPPKVAPKAAPKGPPAGVGVVHGHLMVSNHIGLLEKVLSKDPTRPLSADPAYRVVIKELDALANGPISFQGFSRQAEELQPTYELLKSGKLKDDHSLEGRLLRRFLGSDAAGQAKLNGNLLPPFQLVRRYLAPTGFYSKTEAGGWFIEGFSLKLEE